MKQREADTRELLIKEYYRVIVAQAMDRLAAAAADELTEGEDDPCVIGRVLPFTASTNN
jgi:hypothetical protein